MTDFGLKLYVTGNTPRSGRAIASLRRICATGLDGKHEMAVIGVLSGAPQHRPQDALARDVALFDNEKLRIMECGSAAPESVRRCQ